MLFLNVYILGSTTPEGFVVCTIEGFLYEVVDRHIVKYVRKGHLQTSDDWRQTWKQAKIHKN